MIRKLDLDKVDKWVLFIGLVVFIIFLLNPPTYVVLPNGSRLVDDGSMGRYAHYINWGQMIIRLAAVGGITIAVCILRRCL